MRVNNGKEESTLEVGLIWEVVLCCAGPRHNDLKLCQREAGLLEVCAVLAKDDLPLIFIRLIGVKE